MAHTNTVDRFREFIRKAKPYAVRKVSHTDFVNFLEKSRPLIIKDLDATAQRLLPELNTIRTWLVPENLDLLALAGLSFVEDAYSELLAWLLSDAVEKGSTLERQQAWLRQIGVQEKQLPAQPAEIRTQVVTTDGRPDVVLVFPDLVVVVEAKTGTDEHVTPSGKPQTISYVAAVRSKLRLADHVRLLMVYLTPDGRDAANGEAICTTYTCFVRAISRALPPRVVREPNRTCYALALSHLLMRAQPPNLDAPKAIAAVLAWENFRSSGRPLQASAIKQIHNAAIIFNREEEV